MTRAQAWPSRFTGEGGGGQTLSGCARDMAFMGARLLALPAMRLTSLRGGMLVRHVSAPPPSLTQLASPLSGSGRQQLLLRKVPLPAAASVGGGAQVRAAASSSSSSKKKRKEKSAKAKKDKGRANRRAQMGYTPRPRPDALRKDADPSLGARAKPLREDLDMSELRIDSLLNELVDGGESMSNRAKFRNLPIDGQIMRKITDVSAPSPPKLAACPLPSQRRVEGFRRLGQKRVLDTPSACT